MNFKLPSKFRPRGVSHREIRPGLDLPAWFCENIKFLDRDLYFVWHPFQLAYSDIMNHYSKPGRFRIQEWQGQEVWGAPQMLPGTDEPVREDRWHIWRLCEPGWAHVTAIVSQDDDHLHNMLDRLWLQAKVSDSGRKYRRYLQEEQEAHQEKLLQDRTNRQQDIQAENRGLLKTAVENAEWGRVNPTHPTRDIITSYRGQGSKSKITREITDKEGGLVGSEEDE